MIVTTESGAIYEFEGMKMRRNGIATLRMDGEWLNMLAVVEPVEGRGMHLILEPLSDEAIRTERFTTPVVKIVVDN